MIKEIIGTCGDYIPFSCILDTNMCFQAEQGASLQSAALLCVATETQSVIKALYIPLYLRDTRRPSQVAERPGSKKTNKQKKKPLTVHLNLIGVWLICRSSQWEKRKCEEAAR